MSLVAFSSLAWIVGRWEGTGGDAPFYEAYRSLNDSTIRMYALADPSASVVQDSSLIQLRAGTVTSGTAQMQWVVTRLDSTHVAFAPGRGAGNAFEWHRETPNEWTARLTWDSAGVPRARRYVMRRLP